MVNENKSNYVNTKFSLDNLKTQKKEILLNPVTFTGFDKVNQEKDVTIKEFFDTPDFFLQNKGVAISITTFKGRKTSDLVVRWCGTKRIGFIGDMPELFKMEIPKKASFYAYQEFLATSISELIPAGLGVDPSVIVANCIKICTVKKTREIHRLIHISGMKIDFMFSHAEFSTTLNKNKEIIDMLEVKCDTLNKLNEYNAFIKKVGFNNPTIINIGTSDVALAKKHLFGIE